MRTQLTIGTKVMASVVTLLVLTLVIGFAGLIIIGKFQTKFDDAMNRTVRKIVLADTIDNAESDMRSAQRLVILSGALKSNDVDTGSREFRRSLDISRKSLDGLRPLISTEEGKAEIAEIAARLEEWSRYFDEIERAARSGNAAEADRIRSEKIAPVAAAIEKTADRLTNQQMELLETDKQELASVHTLSQWIIVGLLGVAFVTGAGVVVIMRKTTRQLRQTVTELDQGAMQVASAAAQVSSSSQSLAQGSSEQAASLEETSASSEEINSMAQKNTENTRSAAELVGHAQQKFTEANRSLDQMVTAMQEINSSSEKISKIIKVIDEVAFQTNILALNAAVEAARAGEAGMGFAVVADEVRNLAQRCAQAAKDTASLIEESIVKSHEGQTKVDQVATAIRSITEDSASIQVLVDEVNLGSQEQSRGIEQVAKAMTQMEQVTQQVAASAEESASASEELTAQSATLKDIAARLATMVG
jgi:methyl-accepting chemotaxis protein